ncbi:MAG: FeoB small GTPase domain-containing protein, partial [Planctomycetota bacterium]
MPVKTTLPTCVRLEPLKKAEPKKETVTQKVLLVGSPNVGKSMLFNRLTGRYVTVSNYPGTTIEVSVGHREISGCRYEIIDTPGMYSLSAITAEEKVAADMVLNEKASVVIHVIDSKNIERSLGLTLQLIDAGLAVILVLNMADEARSLGIKINLDKLENVLGIAVLET